MGLGGTHTLFLADAREKALACRRQLLEGVDPIDARNALLATRFAESPQQTFRECALAYIKANRIGWRNEKHAEQWEATLTNYAFPKLGDLQVCKIDTSKVLEVIEPIWASKTETASRIRGRIESVLSWATVRGYRSGDNPARWRGHLDNILPKRSRVAVVRHHPALPFDEAPAFMKQLRNQEGIAARAFEFIVLTVARTGEAIGAKWTEVDFTKEIWSVPAERMKAGRPHKVPLTAASLGVLQAMHEIRLSDFIFPGTRENQPLSNMSCLAVLERMEREDLTVHGFRSTFRDWTAERTNFPREVVEAALAHVIGDKVEAAYRRGDLFEKRRQLMNAWSRYCGQPAAPKNPKGI